jgi:50S ribosomal protein L16 3-hydroxylase
MKKITSSHNLPLQLLGGLSAQQFLDEYWQKKPLLIRGALRGNFAPLTNAEILTLAGYEDAESRLVLLHQDTWSVDDGPFEPATFKQLKKAKDALWTVLVQDVQHFSHEAHALLSHFNFLPAARIDDLMVSYAVEGGGVGPHIDSYDVFLLQGSGARRWQISTQKVLRLKPDMPLKILQSFKPTDEWVLEAGDMLYLPPSCAHHGVAATDDCVTWSIGFRAPSHQECLEAWLDDLRDNLKADGRFTDATRRATNVSNHAALDTNMQAHYATALCDAMEAACEPAALHDFMARYLTAPKPHVEFEAPEPLLSARSFHTRAIKCGISLDLRTRMLYDKSRYYVNGHLIKAKFIASDRVILQQLACNRKIDAKQVKSLSDAALEAIYAEYAHGYLTLTI